MGGDVEQVKERLDIAEVVGGYIKLEKAGQSYKARCPFHNEKTPSFHISPSRQSFYCFGCGAKGDIFTFVERIEGLEFRDALKMLAERAGVELSKNPVQSQAARTEKDKILEVLETATQFFENQLVLHPEAAKYLAQRGISEATSASWRLGYAPAEWRSLYTHLMQLGYKEEILLKAGLVKKVESQVKNPYDVFRDRIIFPLKDASGKVIAFSGRALSKETEPKYLNSPDTLVFTKHEVLYGLDKAKEKIRRLDYTILVEGQIDLVLSHQSGVENTVASSGTAFTQAHLERLKKISKRIILAFDGDGAGDKAAEKSTELAMRLGLEVKIAKLPHGKDPAEIAKSDPKEWKELLRQSLPAIEYFLNKVIEEEGDSRKRGQMVERKILPLVTLLDSSIEKSHFISLIAKRTSIKEEVIWDEAKKVKNLSDAPRKSALSSYAGDVRSTRVDTLRDAISEDHPTVKEQIEERLTEVRLWKREMPEKAKEREALEKEEAELENRLLQEGLKEELTNLTVSLGQAETSKELAKIEEIARRISEVHKSIVALENKRKSL